MIKIEFDEKCTTCKGTGIYVGMAERDGYGVVCNRCNGTGMVHFIHMGEEFSGRIKREDVKRIVKKNPGIALGGDDLDFGGMNYDKWFEGCNFPKKSEMRNFVCPAWWYANGNLMPKWDECGRGRFSECNNFKTKEKCWERFDKEQDNKNV